jgi:flagellar secretion chaperone FliS
VPDPGRTYRQLAAQGASPVGLVIQSYDQIVNALYRAARAMEAGNIEKKTDELNHALALLSRLQNALDFKTGPKVARALERFYNLARARMIEASAKNSTLILNQIAEDFLSLREAWRQVEQSVAASGGTPQPPLEPRPPAVDPTTATSRAPIDWTA